MCARWRVFAPHAARASDVIPNTISRVYMWELDQKKKIFLASQKMISYLLPFCIMLIFTPNGHL
jgi:hypothetical protein